MATATEDPFAALGAVPDTDPQDPFAALGAVDEPNYVESLTNRDDFDPVSYAAENPQERDIAKEVAWRKKQRPMTTERALKLPGIAATTAVGLVKDVGQGAGYIASDIAQSQSDTAANMDRAGTQQMARGQLAEQNVGTFFDKLFGKNSWLGRNVAPLISPQRSPEYRRSMLENTPDSPLAFTKESQQATETDIARQEEHNARLQKGEAPERIRHDEEFDKNVERFTREQELLSGKVQDTGIIGGILRESGLTPSEVFTSPEELEEMGAPVDPEAIRTGAVTGDPTNALPLAIPRLAPALTKVAGVGTMAAGKALALPAKAVEAIGKGKVARGLKYGAGFGLGYETFQDPETAAKIIGVVAALKGAKKFGKLLETSGRKMINPKFVSATEKAGAKAAIEIHRSGGGSLERFTSKAINKADSERIATRTIGATAGAPLAMAPITAAVTDSPEEAAALTGGAIGFGAIGGLSSYNPMKGFHPDMIRAVDVSLREEGAKKKYNTPLDAKHDAWMQNAPDSVREGVNSYRGFVDGYEINGKEPQIYVLHGEEFATEVIKRRPGLSLERARQQRGFHGGDGTVLINGDFGVEAPNILGHEVGGHVVESIIQVLAPEMAKSMRDTAYKGLYENGKPTKKLLDFVTAYNKAFDPSGKTTEIQTSDHAISEWLAENARAILEGEGPAKFAAGESLRQTLADNIGSYYKQIFGTKQMFDRAEIPQITMELGKLLFELGRAKTRVEPGVGHAVEPELSASKITTGPETPVDPMEARVQSAGIDPAVVDAARDRHIGDPREITPTRANTKRGTPGRSREQVIEDREAEWDGMLNNYLDALEASGERAPSNPLELHQAVIEHDLSQGAPSRATEQPLAGVTAQAVEAPQTQSQPLSSVPLAKTSASPLSVPSRPLETSVQTPETAHYDYKTAADEAAAAIEASPEFARKRSERSKAEAIKTARTSAILDRISEEANEAGDKEALQRRVDSRGRARFTGRIDQSNPAHAALLEELGLSEADISKIESFQSGKTFYVDYLSAKNIEPTDITGKQRKAEYKANPPSERGEATATKQRNKAILGITTAITPSGSAIIKGISVDKFIANAAKLMEHAKKAKIRVGYDSINDPTLVEDLHNYVENHRNGWKGDGSGTIADETPTPGYSPHVIPADRFDLLNAAFNADVSTKIASKRAKTREAAQDAQSRALENDWAVDDATGDVNPLRAFLNKSGIEVTGAKGEKRRGTPEILEEVWENLSPDMIEAIKDASDGERDIVREVGYTGDPTQPFAKGAPKFKNIAAGFMPAENVEKDPKGTYWHGSPSGDLRGGKNGLHVGTKRAAQEALEARIGIPAEGEWDGTREYGKTLLAGKDTIEKRYPGQYRISGYNVDATANDYYPTKAPDYGDGTPVAMDAKPIIMRVRIKGPMSNTDKLPLADYKANSVMRGQLTKGKAKRGYFYRNEGEDTGSISAVLPSQEHIERFMPGEGPLSRVKPSEEDASSKFTKMQKPLAEFMPARGKSGSEEVAEDFFERYNNGAHRLLSSFKSAKPGEAFKWPVADDNRMAKIWLDYGKKGIVRDEKGMQAITDRLLDNIAMLRASTELLGHSTHKPVDIAEEAGFELSKSEEETLGDYLMNSKGEYLLSDYGLPQLEKLYDALASADTAEKQLHAADKILNVIHQRSDLAALFVRGGTKTLNRIASQGGYTSPEFMPGKRGEEPRGRKVKFSDGEDANEWKHRGSYAVVVHPDGRVWTPKRGESHEDVIVRLEDQYPKEQGRFARAIITEDNNLFIDTQYSDVKRGDMKRLEDTAIEMGLHGIETEESRAFDGFMPGGESNLNASIEKNVNDALMMGGNDPAKARDFLKGMLERGRAKITEEQADNLQAAVDELEKRAGGQMMPGDLDDLGFYSQLKRVSEEKIKGKVTADQLRATLKNNGVKNEELDWVLGDLLERKKGEKITPEELRAEIEANRVELKEVELGSKGPDDERWKELLRKQDGDNLTAEERLELERGMQIPKDTKFSQYQLPGGENYRELLLTLPVKLPKGFKVYQQDDVSLGKSWGVEFANGTRVGGFPTRESAIAAQRRQPEAGNFESSHFDEPNIIFHARVNDRYTSADGTSYTPPEKMLFAEEVQSDWHQKGRKEGYKISPNQEAIKASKKAEEEMRRTHEIFSKEWDSIRDKYLADKNLTWADFTAAQREELGAMAQALPSKKAYDAAFDAHLNFSHETVGHTIKEASKAPDAPFKGEGWKRLAIKNLIRKAIQEGKDRIGWTTGEQQAERYDLSKQINSIAYNEKQQLRAYDKSDKLVISEEGVATNKLADYIGKEAAERLINSDPREDPMGKTRWLEGEDLKIGGEGMKGFYDKELVNLANDIGKKYGARAEKVKTGTASKYYIHGEDGEWIIREVDGDKKVTDFFDQKKQAEEWLKKNQDNGITEIWSLPITPKMKEAVSGGQAMFIPGGDESINKSLDEIASRYKDNLQARAYVMTSGKKDVIKLDHIQAKKAAPRGAGTQYMEELIKFADENNLPIALQTASKGDLAESDYKRTSSTDRLKDFYKRFGFKSNYGKRSYRPDLPGNMHRNPEGSFQPGVASSKITKIEEAGVFDPKDKKAARAAWLSKKTESPYFKSWFGNSKVTSEDGKPLVVYSGHSNAQLYGNAYKSKESSAGGFYSTEDPVIASNYAFSKLGGKNKWSSGGSEYRFKGANDQFNKKIWQLPDLTAEQQQKVRDYFQDEEGGGVFDLEGYWNENARFDRDAARAKATGGLRKIENIYKFMEAMGLTIAYPEGDSTSEKTITERQVQNRFEDLLNKLGIEWDSYEWSRPGVFPVYLKIERPLDADKPFPEDLLAALKQATKRKRKHSIDREIDTMWTSDYPIRNWVEDIESGSESWTTQIPHEAIPILQRFGYDGIKERGLKGETDRSKRQVNWIAFDAEQIKSATGNIGTFDPNNPDIRFMPGNATSKITKIKKEHVNVRGRELTVYRNKPTGKFTHNPKTKPLARATVATVVSKDDRPLAAFK